MTKYYNPSTKKIYIRLRKGTDKNAYMWKCMEVKKIGFLYVPTTNTCWFDFCNLEKVTRENQKLIKMYQIGVWD